MPDAPSAPRRPADPSRHANLTRLLRQVHLAPTSRSELTRLLGVNRSTIASLVADLEDRGLVTESAPDTATADRGVGRPSPVIRPGDRAVVFAVHLEIDEVRVAAVRLGGRVVATERRAFTDVPSVETAVGAVADLVESLRAALPVDAVVTGVGVSVPGTVRSTDGWVPTAPHLGWTDVPLAAVLAERLALPVRAANEASLGVRAEWSFGAGRGYDDLLFVHGGASGIGGGVIAGGVPLQGTSGYAGEIGHLPLRDDPAVDTVGLRGTLEALVRRDQLTGPGGAVADGAAADGAAVGGAAVTGAATLGAAAVDGAPVGAAPVGALPDLVARLRAEDASRVQAEVARQAVVVGTAAGGAVNLLGSRRVVLGGFLAAVEELAPGAVQASMREHLIGPLVDLVDVVPAALGDELLLVGAALLPLADLVQDVPRLD